METKLGQSFQLSNVRNKSELFQNYVQRYAKEFAIYCDACRGVHIYGYRQKNNRDTIKNDDMFADISLMKKVDITQA